jgi:hypothetical protein
LSHYCGQARKREGKKGEGNRKSERPRAREGMKIERLEMKGKEFLE